MWYIVIHLVIHAVINDKGGGNHSLKLFLFGVQIVIEEIFLTRGTYLLVVLATRSEEK